MEFLKAILGDELYGQVAEKLKGTEVKLVDLKTGDYVKKEKFETMETERNNLQKQLTDANAEIEGFKSMNIDEVKKAAADWETKYNKAVEDSQKAIDDMKYQAALKDALSGEKFSSPYARDGIIAELTAMKLPLENNQIMGLADALKAKKEACPDAWLSEDNSPVPNLGGAGMGSGGKPDVNLSQYAGKTAAELMQIANADPTKEASILNYIKEAFTPQKKE